MSQITNKKKKYTSYFFFDMIKKYFMDYDNSIMLLIDCIQATTMKYQIQFSDVSFKNDDSVKEALAFCRSFLDSL